MENFKHAAAKSDSNTIRTLAVADREAKCRGANFKKKSKSHIADVMTLYIYMIYSTGHI